MNVSQKGQNFSAITSSPISKKMDLDFGLASSTVRLYKRILLRLPFDPKTVTDRELALWGGGGGSPSTRGVRISAVRWARSEPGLSVRRRRQEGSNDWRGWSPGVEEALLTTMRQTEASDLSLVRDRAIVWILYSTGMRAAEVASLDVEDLSGTDGELVGRVVGKGKKTRPFIVPATAANFVRDWIYARPFCQKKEGLFLTRSPKAIWRAVRRLAMLAGVRERVWPHMMRHAFADRLLEASGGDITLVADVLGHNSLDMARSYLARNPKVLLAKIRRLTL